MKIFLYVLAGLVSGILGGMGMGGGTLLIPFLALLKVGQHTSQAINLISFIPMSLVALAIHIKNKLVVFKKVLLLVILAVLFGILGALIAKRLEGDILRRAFGGFLILLAGVQGFLIFKKNR